MPAILRFLTLILAGLAACSTPDPRPGQHLSGRGPDLGARGPIRDVITQLHLDKSDRTLYLISDGAPVRAYDIDLGFSPKGHKLQEGDGRTPEGHYTIDRRNPQSAFYRSIGISYPNRADRVRAARLGVDPGGDIFIHGEANRKARTDWTAGCIAMPDDRMKEIFDVVAIGTPIYISP